MGSCSRCGRCGRRPLACTGGECPGEQDDEADREADCSGSTYPLLGGLRSTAQVISYEIAMGLSFVTVFLLAGTMLGGTIKHYWLTDYKGDV